MQIISRDGWAIHAAKGKDRRVSHHDIDLNVISRKMPSVRFQTSQPGVGRTREYARGSRSLALLELLERIYHHGIFWRKGAVSHRDHRAIFYELSDGVTTTICLRPWPSPRISGRGFP
jgi:hypothetical protein